MNTLINSVTLRISMPHFIKIYTICWCKYSLQEQHDLEIPTSDALKYIRDNPILIVYISMGKSIRIQMEKVGCIDCHVNLQVFMCVLSSTITPNAHFWRQRQIYWYLKYEFKYFYAIILVYTCIKQIIPPTIKHYILTILQYIPTVMHYIRTIMHHIPTIMNYIPT